MGINDHSGEYYTHELQVNKEGVTGVDILYLEVRRWLNEEKTAFEDKLDREWRLVVSYSLPPTHTERLRRVTLMGPGCLKLFYQDEKLRVEFHSQDRSGRNYIWEYQFENSCL